MLPTLLKPYTEVTYTLLRVVTGLTFMFHGMQKLFGVLASQVPGFGSQIWLGGVIEFAAGIGIAAGAYTAYMAFLASGTMAVAYTQFHWKFALGADFFPAINHGELALVYAFVFLYMACRGGGPWSADAWRARQKPEAGL